jgi:hypothetical protein
MSKRLQVILDDAELAAVRRAAKRSQMTTAEWVRQALRAARKAEPKADVGRKLAAVQAAAAYEFPTADLDQMLVEIEQGYLADPTK